MPKPESFLAPSLICHSKSRGRRRRSLFPAQLSHFIVEPASSERRNSNAICEEEKSNRAEFCADGFGPVGMIWKMRAIDLEKSDTIYMQMRMKRRRAPKRTTFLSVFVLQLWLTPQARGAVLTSMGDRSALHGTGCALRCVPARLKPEAILGRQTRQPTAIVVLEVAKGLCVASG